jgi:hypothetical protein
MGRGSRPSGPDIRYFEIRDEGKKGPFENGTHKENPDNWVFRNTEGKMDHSKKSNP